MYDNKWRNSNSESLILEYFFLCFCFSIIKIIKVHAFWKGYKNLKKISHNFVIFSKCPSFILWRGKKLEHRYVFKKFLAHCANYTCRKSHHSSMARLWIFSIIQPCPTSCTTTSTLCTLYVTSWWIYFFFHPEP